jgi:hypothetical protein
MTDLHATPRSPNKPRLSTMWIVILVVGVLLGVLSATFILPLFVVLVPKGRSAVHMLEDTNDIRQVAGLFVVAGSNVPLAPDGRIDVYALLAREKIRQDDILDICQSARARRGPTWAEIEAGDYRNFPYQRYRGVPDRRERVPILWDRTPARGERLVAFSDCSALVTPEETMREFFRSHPGQE